jgi:flagellar biosynthesis/type III secretory pathway ATPase
VDTALLVMPTLTRFLQQDHLDVSEFENTLQSLAEISQISSVN